VDSGIEEGLEVSTYYDSLLAKLIVAGETREMAIERMARALAEYRIVGLPTSIPFHRWVMDHEAFRAGNYHTGFLEDHPSLDQPGRAAHRMVVAMVAALLSHEQRTQSGVAIEPHATTDPANAWSPRSWKMTGRWELLGR
jgi:acetyl/propionyl-CoA carboxylase alpha subunit